MRAPQPSGATFDLAERSGVITDRVQTTGEEFEAELGETDPAWRRLLDAEPARVAGFVTALIALMVAFGLPIAEHQKAAILGFIAAGFALVQAEVTRAAVYSPATVNDIEVEADEAIELAYEAGTEDALG